MRDNVFSEVRSEPVDTAVSGTVGQPRGTEELPRGIGVPAILLRVSSWGSRGSCWDPGSN